MLEQHSPRQNRLLASLPTADTEPLFSQMELVQMRLGERVYESGVQLECVYFPTSAIVSLHYVTESGATCELSGVGNEGVVGFSVLMGGDSTPSSALVHTAGYAYRVQRRVIKQEMERHGAMQRVLLCYVQALMAQISQIAACNRHHSVEQQMCRWLLIMLDRVSSSDLVVTQELIAGALGVRREGITQAAGKLQLAGYIRYRRGHITVLHRHGLETHTCECYRVVRKELDRLALTTKH